MAFEAVFLVALSRAMELLGIVIIIILAMNKIHPKYIYIIAGLIVSSVLFSIVSLFFKGIFYPLSIGFTFLVGLISAGIGIYAYTNKEKTVYLVPEEGERCPVCSKYIRQDLPTLTYLKIDNIELFFDNFDHLIKFLRDLDFYKKMKGLPIRSGKVDEILVRAKDTGNFKYPQNLYVVLEGEEFVAYEKEPKGGEYYTFKEILEGAKT